jgi:WD40 repeat protein
VGQSSLVTVSLNNVPTAGYVSAEITCTYNASLLSVSNIAVAGLFGPNPVVAINGPQNGSFILAMVATGGNKATTSGTVLTFSTTALQVGQSPVICTANVSQGQSIYESIAFVGDTVNILSGTPTPTVTATTVSAPTQLTGQVIASKPVTIRLYNLDSSLAATIPANPDGTFSLNFSPGSYTVVASAEGFLNAQGPVTLTSGTTTTKPTINLIPGDVDGNSVINQLDALTIGMNYNAVTPTAADLNNDGVINVLDLQLLAANYGQSGALAW